MRQQIVYTWNFIFNADFSLFRHIPDFARRHLVLQALGLMWAVSSTVAFGIYTIMAASIVGHIVLIGSAVV